MPSPVPHPPPKWDGSESHYTSLTSSACWDFGGGRMGVQKLGPVLALLPSVGFDLGGGKPDVLSLSSHGCGEVQPDRTLPFRKDPLVCRA